MLIERKNIYFPDFIDPVLSRVCGSAGRSGGLVPGCDPSGFLSGATAGLTAFSYMFLKTAS